MLKKSYSNAYKHGICFKCISTWIAAVSEYGGCKKLWHSNKYNNNQKKNEIKKRSNLSTPLISSVINLIYAIHTYRAKLKTLSYI